MTSLAAELEAAAQIGADGGGVSRFAWSPELAQANAWLMRRLEDLGLETELDPAGNVFGRWDAGEGHAVLVGSHLDTGPRGGRYDGALGVLAALATVRALLAEGVEPRRPIWVVSFNDEEGSASRPGCSAAEPSAARSTSRTGAAAASPTRWRAPASTSTA